MKKQKGIVVYLSDLEVRLIFEALDMLMQDYSEGHPLEQEMGSLELKLHRNQNKNRQVKDEN